MGSNSFNAEVFNPSERHQIIVMTSHPDRYKSREVPGQIEFTSETPAAISSRFIIKGHPQMLVIGGPHIATSFLREQLIDELWLTFEPKIFGSGDNFATGEKLDIDLRLIHSEKVNEQGTLINKYAVFKK